MGKVNAMYQDQVEYREKRAYARGSADAYYGRRSQPHIWLDPMGREVVTKQNMTEDEIESYYRGYEEEDGRKEWD
jgi:hypothetical protein